MTQRPLRLTPFRRRVFPGRYPNPPGVDIDPWGIIFLGILFIVLLSLFKAHGSRPSVNRVNYPV